MQSNDFEVKKRVVKPVVFSDSDERDKIPAIATPDDLIGKLVFDFCVVSHSVVEDWHHGGFVDSHGRGTFLRYERQDALFAWKLFNDFSNKLCAYIIMQSPMHIVAC